MISHHAHRDDSGEGTPDSAPAQADDWRALKHPTELQQLVRVTDLLSKTRLHDDPFASEEWKTERGLQKKLEHLDLSEDVGRECKSSSLNHRLKTSQSLSWFLCLAASEDDSAVEDGALDAVSGAAPKMETYGLMQGHEDEVYITGDNIAEEAMDEDNGSIMSALPKAGASGSDSSNDIDEYRRGEHPR